jgi:hypothetical protein
MLFAVAQNLGIRKDLVVRCGRLLRRWDLLLMKSRRRKMIREMTILASAQGGGR